MNVESNRRNRPLRHSCEKRRGKRLLCSDLVRLSWTEAARRRHEIVVLENLSLSGVGLFTGVPVPENSRIEIASERASLNGYVKHCCFRENGYVIGVELDDDSKWAQQPDSGFLPEHLLDVSLLTLD